MEDIIATIYGQLNAISKKVKNGDCYEIRRQIQLLDRIIDRFFKKTSYAEMLKDANESNEDVIADEGDDDLEDDVLDLIFTIIDNVKTELKAFGLPSKSDLKVGQTITVNNQHSISQSQSLHIEIFKEKLQESLTGKQYKELVEIVKEEKDTKKASSKIVEKLKSFGSDVASNIVATILTNPHLYSSLF